jgi:hypothetical protein
LLLVLAFAQRIMNASPVTDKASSSIHELEEGTSSVADPSGAPAMDAKDTAAAAKSVSSPLTANEGPGTIATAGRAPLTVLPPEPVHLIRAIPGLDVRQIQLKGS